MEEKRCVYCQRYLPGDPRVKGRRKTCGDSLCQRALKKENNAAWRKRNPDYFRNDYERLKVWLLSHPGYLKGYRATHPDYVRRNREAQRQRDQWRRSRLDIQAKIREQLSEITKELRGFHFLIYKTRNPPNPLRSHFFYVLFPFLIYKFR